MHTEHSDKPYEIGSVVAPQVTSNRVYGLMALLEAGLGIVLLILAAGLAYLTVAFLVWAINEGNVPVLGMFMAASIRAGGALVLGIPGLLLLIAARATTNAAIEDSTAAEMRMRRAQRFILLGFMGSFLLCCGAIVAFFVALGFSNM